MCSEPLAVLSLEFTTRTNTFFFHTKQDDKLFYNKPNSSVGEWFILIVIHYIEFENVIFNLTANGSRKREAKPFISCHLFS